MYWMPDNACKECSECGVRFSLVIRRHHCRVCGRIYCSDCCSYAVPSRHVNPGQRGTMKACLRCVQVSKVHRTSLKERSGLRMERKQQPDASSNPFLEVRRRSFEENTPEVSRVAPFDCKPSPEINGIPGGATETAGGDERLLTLYEASRNAAISISASNNVSKLINATIYTFNHGNDVQQAALLITNYRLASSFPPPPGRLII